ncbi:MAG TPA: penicillin-binding protein 2 [Planctomycetes bacterium]|nr:penicillin-binding protein 2 [Planctomycetota bacterium]
MGDTRQNLLRIAGLLFLFYGLVAVRLVHVQVNPPKDLDGKAELRAKRSLHKLGRSEFERGRRGRILDAGGTPLAMGYDTWTLYVDPSLEHRPRPRQPILSLEQRALLTLDALGDLGVQVDPREFVDHALERFRVTVTPEGGERWVRIRRRKLVTGLLAHEKAYLTDVFRRHRIQNFSFEAEARRVYPQGRLAAEVVGFLGSVRAEGRTGDLQGRAGIEMALDAELRGEPGIWRCRKDGRGVELDLDGHWERPRRDGLDVGLTLDVEIQRIVQEELDRLMESGDFECEGASAVVLETSTNRILAMKSLPDASVEDLRAGRASAKLFRSRPVMDSYVPGSTFKPFVMAKARERGWVEWDRSFDTQGGRRSFRLGHAATSVRDSSRHGVLSARDVIVKSSNIGMAMLGFDILGLDRLYEAVDAWEFRRKPGLLFPGQRGARYLSREKANPLFTATRLPYGHEITIPPLLLAAKFGVFGTRGVYHEPRLVDWIGRADGEREIRERPARTILDPRIAEEMRSVLGDVVEDGTARVLKDLPWTAAAKTGTAQVMTKGGHTGKYHASLVAFAPATAPAVTVYVGVYEVSGRRFYGGSTAGPAVRGILERTLTRLGVPKDKE